MRSHRLDDVTVVRKGREEALPCLEACLFTGYHRTRAVDEFVIDVHETGEPVKISGVDAVIEPAHHRDGIDLNAGHRLTLSGSSKSIGAPRYTVHVQGNGGVVPLAPPDLPMCACVADQRSTSPTVTVAMSPTPRPSALRTARLMG